MQDRELLELAAQAAGYEVRWTKLDGGWADGYEALRFEGGTRFDPLTDDGDALRLAVKLGIEVAPEGFSVNRVDARPRHGKWLWEMYAKNGADPLAATRRAIVRAAAEIGKNI